MSESVGSHADDSQLVAGEVDPQFQFGFHVFRHLNTKMELDENSPEYEEIFRLATEMLASLRFIKDYESGLGNGLSILMTFLEALLKDLDEMQDKKLKEYARIRALTKIMTLCHELQIAVQDIARSEGDFPGCDSENCVGENVFCSSSCKDETRFCLFCSDSKKHLKCPVSNCQWTGETLNPKGGRFKQAIQYLEGIQQRRERADQLVLDKGEYFAKALKKIVQREDKKRFIDHCGGLDLVKSLQPFLDSHTVNDGSLFKILMEVLNEQGDLSKSMLILEQLLFVSRAIHVIGDEISKVGEFRCASRQQCLGKTTIEALITNCPHSTRICFYCLMLPDLKCRVLNCTWKKSDGAHFSR